MMKLQRLLLTTVVLLQCIITEAIPAYPGLISRQQPDGTTLSVRLHGDEYLCFITTDDGYTVTRRNDGFYCYARLSLDGQLEPTDYVARDVDKRTAAERQWLKGVSKFITPAMNASAAARRRAGQERQNRARAAVQAKSPLYDYSNFKGLVILVEYEDRKFSREDYPDMADRMFNQKDFHGYGLEGKDVYTGSVRDYFYDNSMGAFDPKFDVVGPVTVNVSESYPNKLENTPKLMKLVADAADSEVDFSHYDLDGDGVVDMVYIIFAGYGSNFDEGKNYIWPHASAFYDPDKGGYLYKDSVCLGNYACSTEMYGVEGYKNFDFYDGIGTICHEFSHMLGLPDLYDTDSEESGGWSNDPSDWSVMSGGGYLNNARTPVGYTLYERYSLGFAMPEVITEEGSYLLEPLAESNAGYRLDTQVDKEFFLIENRRNSSKWDQYLPGHGMLVFRVDSTNANAWYSNMVNCNPNHNYFELVRAGGEGGIASSNPFPGTKDVTMLNNNTSPANLLSWSGIPSLLGFDNIEEEDGVISFNVVKADAQSSLHTISHHGLQFACNTGSKEAKVINGDYSSNDWTSLEIPSAVSVDGTDYVVTRIGNNAFEKVRSLDRVILPEGIQSIGENAFKHCDGLREINLPSTLKKTGDEAFYNCRKLETIISSMPEPCAIKRNVFVNPRWDENDNMIEVFTSAALYVPMGSKSNYTSAEAWNEFQKIYEGELKETTQEGITYSYVTGEDFATIINADKEFFDDKDLVIPSTIEIDGRTYKVKSIANGVFFQSDIKSLTIEPGLEEIGDYAFYNVNSLQTVVLPEGLLRIGERAFRCCYGLNEIRLPSTLKEIGEYAFYDCRYLETIISSMSEPCAINRNVFVNARWDENDNTIEEFTSAALSVPIGSKSNYTSADAWKEFTNITEFDPTGIQSIRAEEKDMRIFDIYGRRLEAPRKGINIIKGSKVIIK